MQLNDLIRSCQQFPAVIPVPQASSLRVTHPSAMVTMVQAPLPHRLACVKHSVSVHPEPGSNSSFNIYFHLLKSYWQELFLLPKVLIYHIFYGICFFYLFVYCTWYIFVSTRGIISKTKKIVNYFFYFFWFFLNKSIMSVNSTFRSGNFLGSICFC